MSLNNVRVLYKITSTFSRRMSWTEHVARMEAKRNAYKTLVRKPGGMRPLGRPSFRWEDGIKMDQSGNNIGGCGLIRMAQDKDRW
jgi:hypothetical protein